MTLQRRPSWPEDLSEFIEGRRERSFLWGGQDCALFAADAVLAMTGIDFAKPWRGYKTERAALSLIKKVGGLRNFAPDLAEKPVGLAQRGDVVIVDIDGRETFGIVVGNGCWCGPGADGLVFRPMNEARTVLGV